MATKRTARTARRPARRVRRPRAPRRSITVIVNKLERLGPKALSPVECCRLVLYQLEAIAEWQQEVWDKIWGTGGGTPPPPPPTWPPS